MTRLYFDGSCDSWGYIIDTGLRIEEVGECSGTSMEAEYSGLINGLNRAIELGVSELEIIGDSKNVIRQILGSSKARGKEKELRDEVIGLLELMPNFTLRHVPRKGNIADGLFR